MRKSVVLFVVMIVLIVLSVFAFMSLYFMTNEARIAEHKIGRMKAFYTAQAAILNAQKRLDDGEASETVEDDINNNFILNNLGVTILIVAGQTDCTGAPLGDPTCCAAPLNTYCKDDLCTAGAAQYCVDTKVDY